MSISHLVVLGAVLALLAPGVMSGPQELKLVDNGYEGLVVSIAEDIPEDQCRRIIRGLRNVMSEFSAKLYGSTDGRASLRQVTVALPKTWRTDSPGCSLQQQLSAVAPPIKSHISVTKSHPVFGSYPWAQQTRGCGQRGDQIKIGAEKLYEASNDTHAHTARLLVSEWTKYRYGVFEEFGHIGDTLYPALYRDPVTQKLRRNECSDVTQPQEPFCSAHKHVPEAPTKHNALCGGRSAWDIIMQSEDFRDGRNPSRNRTGHLVPSFRFVQETSPRFVIAVEDTAIMNMQRRWEFVRKAVRRIAVYDIPDGAHVGLVVFNSVAKTVAPLSRMDSKSDVRQRIGSSLPRNPSTVPESHKCVLCGLQEAIRAFDSDSIGAAGANIILITTGAGAATHHQMDEMIRLVKTRQVRVTPILYPLTDRPGILPFKTSHNLEPLVEASGSGTRTFTVMDEGVGKYSKVSMMVALMDALMAAVRESGPVNAIDTPLLVSSTGYPGGIASLSTGSFSLDDSIGPDVRFSVYYYDLNHVGNTIQLTTPSGKILANANMQEEDTDANVIFINIQGAERGVWRYKIENRADSHQGLYVQVTAVPSRSRKVNVRVWTNSEGIELNPSDPSQPTILFAEVKEGDNPVLNAHVVAKLQRLGTNASGSSYTPTYIELFDNGIGDPDITGGDGVYTRYLPQMLFTQGHYELTVTATHNNGLAKVPVFESLGRRGRMEGMEKSKKCCGSAILYQNVKPVAPFSREVPYGVVSVTQEASDKDVFPPSRILDLRVNVNDTTREVTLRWTASGDDYDYGRANLYEAVMAESWSQAKAMDGQHITGMPSPNTVPNEQVMILNIRKYEQIIYVAMRAIDKAGNKGGVSNVASFIVPAPPTTQPPPMTFPSNAFPRSSVEPRGNGISHQTSLGGFTIYQVVTIIGACLFFILIALVIVLMCHCYHKRSKINKQKKQNEKVENNRNSMIKSNSVVVIDHEESHDSADSTIKDADALKQGRPLSPVQSWAPSKLLAEHERRFSVTSGPTNQPQPHVMDYNASMQEPFPDVTLTGGHSYPSSQTPSTTNSEPPAYQQSYPEGYAPYPYQYNQGYGHEELPPYTPGLSSQSSQASTAYTHEIPHPNMDSNQYPVDMQLYPSSDSQNYPVDMPTFISENYNVAQPAMYHPYQEDPSIVPVLPSRTKVPPPVAPKPMSNRPPVPTPPVVPTTQSSSVMSNSNNFNEPKRRNVTQV